MAKFRKWDISECLDSDEMIANYLTEAIKDGDPSLLAAAIGDVAKAKGMTELSKKLKMSRTSLYKSLSKKGRPEMFTIIKILNAFNIQIVLRAG